MHAAHAVATTATRSGGMRAISCELTNSCRFAASVRNTSPQRHAREVVAGTNWTNIVQSLISTRGHFDYLGSQCDRESWVKKKEGYSHAQITAHMQFWLTWHMRESLEKCLDIDSWICLVEKFVACIGDVIDVHDADARMPP